MSHVCECSRCIVAVIIIKTHPLTMHSFFLSYTNRKDQKKVDKLAAMIPYHDGRKNTEEVDKIKQQIAKIWEKTREAAYAGL